MAGWLSVPAVWRAKDLASALGAAAMHGLRVSELGDRRDNLPGHAETAHGLVPGDVGRHQPKERRQCYRTATGAWLGELRHGLDLAA
jgi:hypothetical protein